MKVREAIALMRISIHAPTRGATLDKAMQGANKTVNFNPRSHEGSDCNID